MASGGEGGGGGGAGGGGGPGGGGGGGAGGGGGGGGGGRGTGESGFTVEAAGRALEAACGEVGLDAAGARLVRLGSNAVYALADGRVIVRIAADAEELAEVRQAVAVARWLAEVDLPANRLV